MYAFLVKQVGPFTIYIQCISTNEDSSNTFVDSFTANKMKISEIKATFFDEFLNILRSMIHFKYQDSRPHGVSQNCCNLIKDRLSLILFNLPKY